MNNKGKSIRELMALARGQLIGRYYQAILANGLVMAIQMLIIMLINNGVITSVSAYLLSLGISIVVDLLSGALFLGQSYFNLKFVRYDKGISLGDVFYGFKNNLDKAIYVQMIFTFVSLVGSLPGVLVNFGIFEVPEEYFYQARILITGIQLLVVFVARLFYGLSFYVLSDHPDYTVGEVLSESLNLMKKRKGKLFLTYLSMIPYMLLGIFACCVGYLWFVALEQTVLADFYIDAIGEEPATQFTPDSDQKTDYSI